MNITVSGCSVENFPCPFHAILGLWINLLLILVLSVVRVAQDGENAKKRQRKSEEMLHRGLHPQQEGCEWHQWGPRAQEVMAVAFCKIFNM